MAIGRLYIISLNAIKAVRTVLPDSQIIVIDDGSTDKTFEEAEKEQSALVKVFSIPHAGKGAAIRRGIEVSSGDIIVQYDADMQFEAQSLPSVISPVLEGNADIVFGSRYLKNAEIEHGSISLVKRCASWFVAKMMSLMCGQSFTDVFAGVKAFRAGVIKDLDISQQGFAYEAEIAIKAKKRGYVIVEVPVNYSRRVIGESNIRLVYHSFSIFAKILWMYFCVR